MINEITQANTSQNIVILGDLNLDASKASLRNYQFNKLYQVWLKFVDDFSLFQHVSVPTWNRLIQGKEKSSILDHFYTRNPTEKICFKDTSHSDHLMIGSMVMSQHSNTLRSGIMVRNWKIYDQGSLLSVLENMKLNYGHLSVQDHADALDQTLMTALDKIVPEKYIRPKDSRYCWSIKILRLRKRKRNLYKKAKKNNCNETLKRCKHLEKQ